MVGGLRQAASSARQTSRACLSSRLHVSFVLSLLVRPQSRLRTESRLGLEALRSGLSPQRVVGHGGTVNGMAVKGDTSSTGSSHVTVASQVTQDARRTHRRHETPRTSSEREVLEPAPSSLGIRERVVGAASKILGSELCTNVTSQTLSARKHKSSLLFHFGLHPHVEVNVRL